MSVCGREKRQLCAIIESLRQMFGAGTREHQDKRKKVNTVFLCFLILIVFKSIEQVMVSNFPYVKGVRTRYVTTLTKNKTKQNGLDILDSDAKSQDETALIMKINRCIDRLQLYCEKVEIQTDKVAKIVDSSESELTAQLIAETDLVSLCNELCFRSQTIQR